MLEAQLESERAAREATRELLEAEQAARNAEFAEETKLIQEYNKAQDIASDQRLKNSKNGV